MSYPKLTKEHMTSTTEELNLDQPTTFSDSTSSFENNHGRDPQYLPSTLRILLVEDNDADAVLVGEMFQELHEMLRGTCKTILDRSSLIVEAEKILKEKFYDAILLDLHLPDSKGLQTLQRLRALFSDIPIIILSGRTELNVASRAVSHGAQDFLVKGTFHSDLLLRAILYARERKLREKELETIHSQLHLAERLRGLGLLAGGVAHDFNNLLHALMGNLGLARLQIREDDKALMFLDRADKVINIAAKLVQQLLTYGGKGRVTIDQVSVSEVVEGMTQLLRSCLKGEIELIFNLDPDVAKIAADPSQISQIILNLVLNAVDALSKTGGKIVVSTGVRRTTALELRDAFIPGEALPGEHVFIRVEDSGSGMTDEIRKSLFDPFFSTKSEGRGLGLAAVWGIVQRSNGFIEVYSKLGLGTTFTVSFPTITTDAEYETTDKAKDVAINGTNVGVVMVVEDDPSIRQPMTELLEISGYEVVTASTGQEAIKKCTALGKNLGLVISDIMMPEMDGLELFNQLRAMRSTLPVILMSGYDDKTFKLDESAPGVVFLQKPYGPLTLITEVKKFLRPAKSEDLKANTKTNGPLNPLDQLG